MAARRPNGVNPLPLRSFRVPDEIWKKSQLEAKRRDETLSSALNRFLACYSEGGDAHSFRSARPRGVGRS